MEYNIDDNGIEVNIQPSTGRQEIKKFIDEFRLLDNLSERYCSISVEALGTDRVLTSHFIIALKHWTSTCAEVDVTFDDSINLNSEQDTIYGMAPYLK